MRRGSIIISLIVLFGWCKPVQAQYDVRDSVIQGWLLMYRMLPSYQAENWEKYSGLIPMHSLGFILKHLKLDVRCTRCIYIRQCIARQRLAR